MQKIYFEAKWNIKSDIWNDARTKKSYKQLLNAIVYENAGKAAFNSIIEAV